MKKKIAIYGGAFSPPHIGHASITEAVLRLFPCDEIWLMPSADRHDKKVSALGRNRLEMLQLMISELFPNPQIPILISDIELKRGKPTITFETKEELENKFPDYEFHFVLGSDLLDSIEEKWINGRELFDKMNFLAIKNPNISLPDRLPSHLILLEDVVWVNISSTFVRKIISDGFSGMPYLSKDVSNHIKKERLYLTQ
ncbi:MAG TPA: nicotinate-nucleotide adenylyltransferase [Candidatus Paceibacterota bacterium]